MLRLILADAELETIPENMRNDYTIKKMASKFHKDPSLMILDSNYMHTSIDKYFPGKSTRRGRPDIVYIFLQMAMESILNKNGLLEIYVHTRNNLVISINPQVNLPKSYNRFIGLMEDLFKKKVISNNDKVLLSIKSQNLIDFLESLDGESILMSPKGKETSIHDIVQKRDINVIIGGFSEGDFLTDLYKYFESYSIFGQELTIWSVGMEIISEYERFIKIV